MNPCATGECAGSLPLYPPRDVRPLRLFPSPRRDAGLTSEEHVTRYLPGMLAPCLPALKSFGSLRTLGCESICDDKEEDGA
jgi:hypothetical protein